VRTVAFQGIEAVPVDVQVMVAPGKVGIQIVGLPDKAVAESRERVQAALHASGLSMPAKKVTVNLAPADLPKEGSHYDLPIALGLMAALGAVAVRDDEAAFLRENPRWHVGMRGEEKAVGMEPVFRPFAVDAKILDRRFDLDDPDVALARHGDEIGTATGRQRQFRQHMRAHLEEQALDAAADNHSALGLAAVDKGIERDRRNDGHGGTMPPGVHVLNPYRPGDCIFDKPGKWNPSFII
jgi:hypothetical protein